MDYIDMNAETIDRWVEGGWEWGKPVSHEVYEAALAGSWSVVLTAVKPVPKEWFFPMKGCRILGLAAGGAQQMPVFAALGAKCTVLDYSKKQLESERAMARQEGYESQIVRASMTDPLPFEDGSFDLIFHPVSNCYIEKVEPVWRECYRVLRPGGRLLAGMDNGINYIVDETEKRIVHRLPFNPLKDRALMEELEKENGGVQFSHTMEEQLRGQLKAGFRLLDLYEDTNGSGYLHEMGIPSFWASLAEK